MKFRDLWSSRIKKTNTETADLLIVSYPKSGRTWLRMLVGSYVCNAFGLSEDLLLETTRITRQADLPVTEFTHADSALRTLVSFKNYKIEDNYFYDRPIVFLSREIKDTLVSAYYQATYRAGLFEGSLPEFIRSDLFGVRKIVEFYNVWLDHLSKIEHGLVISYEGLHKDPEDIVGKVLRFMEVNPIDPTLVSRAVNYCAFENMKRLERQGTFAGSILNPADRHNEKSYKVRLGKVGGYNEELSRECVQHIENAIDEFGHSGLRDFVSSGRLATNNDEKKS